MSAGRAIAATIALASLLGLLALLACRAAPAAAQRHERAQSIVDAISARHPELARLTLHATPTGATGSRILASNWPNKIGKPSDPEDLEVLRTGVPIELAEGAHLDLTSPVLDASGRAIAAIGVTVSGFDAPARQHSARAIAAEFSAAIVASLPLW
ncbi:MAG: hypothetical protein EPO68_08230 [Planctomycetota bacterium]|nr:MAG: hypothetical protein EPO68_08230 [Planctomycetota bacterium]